MFKKFLKKSKFSFRVPIIREEEYPTAPPLDSIDPPSYAEALQMPRPSYLLEVTSINQISGRSQSATNVNHSFNDELHQVSSSRSIVFSEIENIDEMDSGIQSRVGSPSSTFNRNSATRRKSL